ncbi:MAG: DnaJ, partial [Spartobacteria bacterium]|nr:DnaJ [Spartobacteria bacterium]
KNIEGIVKISSSTGALAKGSVPETVIGGALIPVHQHIVGFAEFLEFFLGVRIAGILIGMVLNGKLAIGTLDLFGRNGALYTEHLVVITFVGCGHLRK